MIACGIVAGIGGCFTAPRVRPSLDDDDPISKIPAIKASARLKDPSAAAALVESLDDDDPAVRFYAIRALTELTGETFGYRYYDDDLERRPALERWRQWLIEQTATTAPATTPAP
jgi:hypothetical protein